MTIFIGTRVSSNFTQHQFRWLTQSNTSCRDCWHVVCQDYFSCILSLLIYLQNFIWTSANIHFSKSPVQPLGHWPKFLTAVHICIGVFSDPLWSINLSVTTKEIYGLLNHYFNNYLFLWYLSSSQSSGNVTAFIIIRDLISPLLQGRQKYLILTLTPLLI